MSLELSTYLCPKPSDFIRQEAEKAKEPAKVLRQSKILKTERSLDSLSSTTNLSKAFNWSQVTPEKPSNSQAVQKIIRQFSFHLLEEEGPEGPILESFEISNFPMLGSMQAFIDYLWWIKKNTTDPIQKRELQMAFEKYEFKYEGVKDHNPKIMAELLQNLDLDTFEKLREKEIHNNFDLRDYLTRYMDQVLHVLVNDFSHNIQLKPEYFFDSLSISPSRFHRKGFCG